MRFAKLFGEQDQVLLLLGDDEDDHPALHFYCQPEDMGLCYATLSFMDDDEGTALEKAQTAFDVLTEVDVRDFCRKLISDSINEKRRH